MSGKGKVIYINNKLPLRMHATPDLKARKVGSLEVGDLVDIEKVEEKWMSVYDPRTGVTGWVVRKFIEELPPPPPDICPPDFPPSNGLCYWPWLGVIAAFAALVAVAMLLYWPR